MVQLCIWFKEEPSQFSMDQTVQSLTCSIMEKPHTGLEESYSRVLEQGTLVSLFAWNGGTITITSH